MLLKRLIIKYLYHGNFLQKNVNNYSKGLKKKAMPNDTLTFSRCFTLFRRGIDSPDSDRFERIKHAIYNALTL